MDRAIRRAGLFAGLLAYVWLVLGLAGYCSGLRINTTKSIPIGVYRLVDEPLSVGSYVSFCPPDSEVFQMARNRGYIGYGQCPRGYEQVFKKVLALEGGVYSINSCGVYVDGRLIPLSQPRTADTAGKLLPMLQIDQETVGAGQVLLMSDVSSTSFDGRYFGLVSRDAVVGVIRPVLTSRALME